MKITKHIFSSASPPPYLLLTFFLPHLKAHSVHFNGFIASSACIHKIMEHADLIWLWSYLIIHCYSLFIIARANYFVLGKAEHHAQFSFQTVHIRAMYVSARHCPTLLIPQLLPLLAESGPWPLTTHLKEITCRSKSLVIGKT